MEKYLYFAGINGGGGGTQLEFLPTALLNFQNSPFCSVILMRMYTDYQ